MRILLIHQNFPGQFKFVAEELRQRGHDVRALTDARNRQRTLIDTVFYSVEADDGAGEPSPALAKPFVHSATRGAAAARAMLALKTGGFVPDLIVGSPGWGETLFCRDVFPAARLILHAEFYYGATAADAARPGPGPAPAKAFALRARNAAMLLAMIDADALVAPTRWQAARFPAALQSRLHTAHEGIDTTFAVPDPEARLTLKREGVTLRAGEPVVTFVNRNFEPVRGFHTLMRSLPALFAACPTARVILVGGDAVSYGAPPEKGGTWRGALLAELRDRLPMDRMHFVGRIPHSALMTLFQVSAAHVYLSYPFVLSWSMLEAMSAGALVVGSRTPPVEEVLADGENGLLVDLDDPDGLAKTLIDTLAQPDAYVRHRMAARRTILDRYDLATRCLPRWLSIVEAVMGGPV